MFRAVCRTARRGQFEVLNRLTALGMDIHLENSERLTPLNEATLAGDINAMEILIKAGARSNDSSLQIASRRLHAEGIALLQAHGHDTQWPSDLLGGRPALAELCHAAHGSGPSWERLVEDTMGKLTPLLGPSWKFEGGRTVLHLIIDNPTSAIPILRAFLRVSKLVHNPRRDDEYLYVDLATGLHYSPTMYVKHRCPGKSERERTELTALLKSAQFTDRYYAKTGQQPHGYQGLPETLQREVEEQAQMDWKNDMEMRRAEMLSRNQMRLNEEANQLSLFHLESQGRKKLELDEQHNAAQQRQIIWQHSTELVHTKQIGETQLYTQKQLQRAEISALEQTQGLQANHAKVMANQALDTQRRLANQEYDDTQRKAQLALEMGRRQQEQQVQHQQRTAQLTLEMGRKKQEQETQHRTRLMRVQGEMQMKQQEQDIQHQSRLMLMQSERMEMVLAAQHRAAGRGEVLTIDES